MSAEITVYWRPGCVYCMKLWVKLRLTGTRYRPVNIWRDPGAAAYVRGVAQGNETVPTVRVRRADGAEHALVNPTLAEVRRAVSG
ncbi:glutaredoxin domain-containing protein [Streptomyces sp. G-G2]|uniref:glutaredoxin domain-containing protein n=1 Tax=Streptomyces sp. G-G2 TaxID=3046201 RepID=UPI0024BB21B6|nr:glutaredoxin domain-containing protein [Streptomyces sp. G-G2]MDJ0381439.1 glutaredoxin domain-containing protein [Streptomyces sp. G-G2]